MPVDTLRARTISGPTGSERETTLPRTTERRRCDDVVSSIVVTNNVVSGANIPRTVRGNRYAHLSIVSVAAIRTAATRTPPPRSPARYVSARGPFVGVSTGYGWRRPHRTAYRGCRA